MCSDDANIVGWCNYCKQAVYGDEIYVTVGIHKYHGEETEKHDNCYTDVSSLSAFMSKDPRTYLEFISRHQNRILFGSDALIDQPETVQSTMQFFFNFIDDHELSHKIFHENYLNFHKA